MALHAAHKARQDLSVATRPARKKSIDSAHPEAVEEEEEEEDDYGKELECRILSLTSSTETYKRGAEEAEEAMEASRREKDQAEERWNSEREILNLELKEAKEGVEILTFRLASSERKLTAMESDVKLEGGFCTSFLDTRIQS